MRLLVSALTATSLGACATAPPAGSPLESSAPSVPATTGAESPEGARLARLLAQAGRSDAPTRAAVERSLGAPDIERQDGAGVALTYRLDSCALLLLFVADARSEMRLAQAHASARRAGAETPSLDRCGAEAAARRR